MQVLLYSIFSVSKHKILHIVYMTSFQFAFDQLCAHREATASLRRLTIIDNGQGCGQLVTQAQAFQDNLPKPMMGQIGQLDVSDFVELIDMIR